MTPAQASSILALLSGAYPHIQVTRETVEAYRLCLADMDAGMVRDAVKEHIATSKFWPSIAEIRERAARGRVNAPLPDEAFAQIRRAADATSERHLIHPIALDALEDIGGWWPIMRGDDMTVLRGQFVRAYQGRLDRHLHDVSTGKAAPMLGHGAESHLGLRP